jgi:hypothetical protein
MYNAYNKITSNLSTFEESGYQDPFQLNTFSGALLLKADVAYKINKQWSIVCGPSMECMFSSLTTKIEGESMSRIYDYSYLLNLGVSYRIL